MATKLDKNDKITKIAGDGPGRVWHERTGGALAKYEGVGNEKRPDLKGTQEGGSRMEAADMHVGHSHLGHAVAELHAQHPHHHSVGGVHHTQDHIRHKPLHAMEEGGRNEYSARMHPGSSHRHPEHKSKHLK